MRLHAWGIGVRVRRVTTVIAAAALLGAGLVAVSAPAVADTAPADSSTPATVSADALPTVQQNGVVWAQVTVGNTVYATGSFTSTWPAGQASSSTNQTPRSNLLAYDITTGNLVTSFDHNLNAQGLAITASPDGSRVYVVGDFTTVDGQTRNHIAAFDTASGALVSNFAPSISASTRAVTATNSTVYVGGNFFNVGGVPRTRLAAVSASGGSLLSWAPTADDNQVDSMVLAPDGSRVIVGGRFTTLNGQRSLGIGAVDATSGASLAFALNTTIQNATTGTNAGKCGITSLSADGSQVYGTGFAFGCGNFEGRFAVDPDTGNAVWINDCHGDSYSTAAIGKVVYSVGHAHECTAIGGFPDTNPRTWHRALAETTYATGSNVGPDDYGWNYNGQPDSTQLDWYPTLSPGTYTHQVQAGWSVTGNANYLAVGGEFPSVNGVSQAGLVRFAVRSAAPNKVGPVASASLTPAVSSPGYGAARLTWTGTYDPDNSDLSYNILRDGSSTPIATITKASRFWKLPAMVYTDTGLTPGSSHTYRISVADPLGNRVGSGTSAAVTVSSTGTPPANAAPSASFTSSCSQLSCQFDATNSSDPDGAIAKYQWDFGDGTTATGQYASHKYAAGGNDTVTLTVTDNGGATATTTRTVTVTAPANRPPNALFTSNCSALTCTLDASASSDTDGTIASYAWNYGDPNVAGGGTGTGRTSSHAYTAAGTATVTLTVTDDRGATASTTRQVTLTKPVTTYATDGFNRTVANGWGSADTGGAWSAGSASSVLSVTPGSAALKLTAAGKISSAYLGSVSTTDSDTTTTFTTDSAPSGQLYVDVLGRRVSASSDYRARVHLLADGSVGISLLALNGGAVTAVKGEQKIAGLSFAAGTKLNVRVQVTGTNPTTVQARVWAAGTSEPSTWQVSGTDSTAALQTPGSVGLSDYLPGTATNAPISALFSAFAAQSTGR